jgi:hypothetical protein
VRAFIALWVGLASLNIVPTTKLTGHESSRHSTVARASEGIHLWPTDVRRPVHVRWKERGS